MREAVKKLILLLSLTAVLPACSGRLPSGARKILSHIEEPVFRPVDYPASDFGAVADSVTDCRAAINEAITRCSDDGGGRVVLPVGKVFCKGSIAIKSNVNLCIPQGCTLSFSADPKDYLPAEITVSEGVELYNYSCPIRSYHCSNIAITGSGTINGNAGAGFCKMPNHQHSAQQDVFWRMGKEGVPVRERYFGETSILPPNFIEPFGCKNVLIEGVTIVDSPYWTIHPTFCDNVIVRGVTIDSRNRYNDGCDPEYSTNVLIEKCRFNTRDDAIAIKAGRDQDAWRIGQKTAGIVIRDCEFASKRNGLCIGSEMAAGVENVYMYNVHISNCWSAIYFKSNLDRGGFIRNIWVKDISIDKVRTAFIRFENNYHSHRGGFNPTSFSDFRISNVKGDSSGECGIYVVGVEGYPIKNVELDDVVLRDCKTPYILANTENFVFRNVVINGTRLPESPEGASKELLRTD